MILNNLLKHKYLQVIENLSNKFDSMSKVIEDLVNNNKYLKNKISGLETNVNGLEKQIASSGKEFDDVLFSECIDRQNRAHNLIIYNVPDNSNDLVSQNDDKSYVINIFTKLNVNVIPLNCFRLGIISSKPRPLKVQLDNTVDVFSVLKCKRNSSST